MNQFRMHVTYPKDVMSLSDLIQGPGESLKNYLELFNIAITEISNPKDDAILMALTMGVDPDSDFGDWLSRKPPLTLDNFYSKASQYLRMEEVLQAR